jgi:beta-lactamase superfamily II metal-dependent hydrolase
MGIRFEFLKAGNGDCIFISTDEGINILIDGGIEKTYDRELKLLLKREVRDRGLQLDLVVLTHYDDDHIAGLLRLLEYEIKKLENKKSTIIKELWFNSFDEALVTPINYSNNTSAKQQIKFDDYIKELLPHIIYKSPLSIDEVQDIFMGDSQELKITLLSPNNKKLEKLFLKYEKETKNNQTSARSNDYAISIKKLAQEKFKKDTSLSNGASIAFILEYKNKKFLFLGDAHIDLIIDSLEKLGYNSENRLELEFVKLSHHGSSKNLNSDFLDLIDTDRFVILTNGGRHQHPNKEVLSKIVTHHKRNRDEHIEFIYNYEHTRNIFTPDEKREYKIVFKNEILSY